MLQSKPQSPAEPAEPWHCKPGSAFVAGDLEQQKRCYVNGGTKGAAGSPVKRKKKRSGLRINRPTSGGGNAGLNIAN